MYVGCGVALERVRPSEVAHLGPRQCWVVEEIALGYWDVHVLDGRRIGLSGWNVLRRFTCTGAKG
jgi:hypothetical protein